MQDSIAPPVCQRCGGTDIDLQEGPGDYVFSLCQACGFGYEADVVAGELREHFFNEPAELDNSALICKQLAS